METRAPALVAIVVTTGSAPGLESTLTTLAGQGYDELSILVIANGDEPELARRVAATAPTAFVRVLEENRGFAAACNEAALMVEGASFLLFCHDDVILFEGAVQRLVESAFRTNAGIVTPKVVAYDDPYILVHVGQVADRFGTVRERVELGEIDHGQQDLERDVFVAPGGVTLVRTDLFETLGGFDPLIPMLGEDLDLCWRAQIAGARIVVAPEAVVAHRQSVATGDRPITAVGTRSATRRDLQRRHQLATVLTCWSRHTLGTVVPTLLVLDTAEMALALIGRDPARARAIVGSWRWAWRNRHYLRERRRELDRVRVLRDAEVLRLQVGGASRLKTFTATLLQEGLDRARGMLPEPAPLEGPGANAEVGFAAAFLDDEAFDAITVPERTWRPTRVLSTGRAQLALVAVLIVLWLIGTRDLFATPLPIVGRLAPLSSWLGNWRHFFASWSPNGIGTGTPGSPGYGLLGFFGTFVFGRMGLLPRAALILAVPLGALGTWRLLRSVLSTRARLVGAVAYVAFPVSANLIQSGRIDVLVVVAVLPFALRRLFTLLDAPGFRLGPLGPTVPFGHRGWGDSRSGQIAFLVLQVALMTAFAPAALVVVELVIVAVWLARAISNSWPPIERPLALAAEVLVGTALLLLPLTFDTLAASSRALGVFGLEGGSWTALSLSGIVRGANGSFGGGWGGWLLPAVAVAGLALARGARRDIANTFGAVAALAVALCSLVGRDWLGAFAPDENVLLVLLAIAVASLVAVAVGAVENDVATANVRWRRPVAMLAVAAIVVASLPLFAQIGSGRFDLPTTGTPETLGRLSNANLGGSRVLWLGEPDALPVAGWSVTPGLAAATTTGSLPSGSTLFSPPDPGAASGLLSDVSVALSGETVRLGQLLASAGVSTVVVVTQYAPTLPDLQRIAADAPPAALVASLERQVDLTLSAHTAGVYVFRNTVFHGILSERTTRLASSVSPSDPTSTTGFMPVMTYGTLTGPVSKGTVLAAVAPASAFELSVDGHDAARSVSLGGDAVFNTRAGVAQLVLHQWPLNGVLAALTMALWVALGFGFGVVEWLERATRKRRVGVLPSSSEES